MVDLPGARDITRAQTLLSSPAQLEFWETYQPNNQALQGFFFRANDALRSLVDVKEEAQEEDKQVSEIDSLLSDVSQDSLDLVPGVVTGE